MTDQTDSLVAVAVAVDQEELHGSRVCVGIGFSPVAVRTARRGPAGLPVEAVSPACCWDR
jgi:hypothetical protein